MQSKPFYHIQALSPLDGRYHQKLSSLREYFSEFALIRARLEVEVEWLISLADSDSFTACPTLAPVDREEIRSLYRELDAEGAQNIKNIEKVTNHDVKAVEYFLQEYFSTKENFKSLIPFIHFSCTSEDINNVAYSLMVKRALSHYLIPQIIELKTNLATLADTYHATPMLSRTHGQAATPTTIGKEFKNFYHRLNRQLGQLIDYQPIAKFNGAVGNYNAHVVAAPQVNWPTHCEQFITGLGLAWQSHSTQIEPHDHLAELLNIYVQISAIGIDLARDCWGYISLGYFQLKRIDTEVGSSTMPHKINPIDFENAEGNYGLCTAVSQHLSRTLPISRWQRDLSDSTTLRNLGSAVGYFSLATNSMIKGLSKISVNEAVMGDDLDNRFEILTEAIQTTMRCHGVSDAYEQLKNLSRGESITQATIAEFIQNLTIPEKEKRKLLALTPSNYLGLAPELAKE